MKTQAGFRLVDATIEDLDAVYSLIDRARALIHELNINQWVNGYPAREDIERDIREGHTKKLIRDDGALVATAYLSFDPDPNYEVLVEGNWKNDEPHGVLHRIAVDPEMRGQGIAGILIKLCIEEVLAHGLKDVRVDTHEENIPMRRALEKAGFVSCGIVRLPYTTDLRVAYEYVHDEAMQHQSA